MNYIGIANNESLLEIYKQIDSGSLILNPGFQRNLVWNVKHKQSFIETILMGYPFPEIYLAAGDIDLDNQISYRVVVDGQQRLDTIYSYIRGLLIFDSFNNFDQLTAIQKTNFYDYKIVVRDLGRIEDCIVAEIFKRINSVQYALNSMEINNALYEGEFIQTARDVIDNTVFRGFSFFSENEYARMKDIEYVLVIMATIEERGYFSGTNEVEHYIKMYDDVYPNRTEVMEKLVNTFVLIQSLNFEYDSIWFRKSSFFSLVIELTKLHSYIASHTEKLRQCLCCLEEKIFAHKSFSETDDNYAQFYKYMYQATSSRTGRVIRGSVIYDEVCEWFDLFQS